MCLTFYSPILATYDGNSFIVEDGLGIINLLPPALKYIR